MATEKQIQANRNNAKKSTGPRTEQGKAASSQNALKHGLLARDAVLPGEDPADYEAQIAALEADIQPEGQHARLQRRELQPGKGQHEIGEEKLHEDRRAAEELDIGGRQPAQCGMARDAAEPGQERHE